MFSLLSIDRAVSAKYETDMIFSDSNKAHWAVSTTSSETFGARDSSDRISNKDVTMGFRLLLDASSTIKVDRCFISIPTSNSSVWHCLFRTTGIETACSSDL